MNHGSPIAERFVSAVRRRIWAIRIGESIAKFVAGAAGVGIFLLAILWVRGQSGVGLSVGILVAGAVLGMLHGITRRPSRMAAAREADTQLNLHDLLGTVISSSTNVDADWRQALAAYAEERCRSMRPSDVIVAKIGLRGWAGVGIAGVLLMTAALLTARPASVAANAGDSREISTPEIAASSMDRDSAGQSSKPDRPPGPGGTDSAADRNFQSADQEGQISQEPGSPPASKDGIAGQSSGAGISTSAAVETFNPPPPSLAAAFTRRGRTIADGNGPENPAITTSGKNDSLTAGPETNRDVPAWESSADDPKNVETVDVDNPPDPGNADLMRDYFRR